MPQTCTPVLAAILVLGVAAGLRAQIPASAVPTTRKEGAMTMHATGTFEVKVSPITTADTVDTGGFSRLALDKKFSGDLTGTSLGQMLASGGPKDGSGAYVALERVTGTLNGRTGSFALMHNGTMTPESIEMRISVVPGSGTGELSGIAGTFTLVIEGKTHSWTLEYTISK
ncbi:MAG: DUF3224 domain-containing protein [Gemmatimonadota bacterium]